MKIKTEHIIIALALGAFALNNNQNGRKRQDAGGLKEWTTDQSVDEENVMDADAAALEKEAEQEDICVPIGEGENCW